MERKIKDIFNEDELQALKDVEKDAIEKAEELPMYIEIDQDRMVSNNEQYN